MFLPFSCYLDGDKLFCTTCNVVLDYTRKSSVDSHMLSVKHKSKATKVTDSDARGATPQLKQKTIRTTLASTKTDHSQEKLKYVRNGYASV